MEAEFRVLEFYSGIGGMHYALQDSGLNAKVVAALDINTVANQVYQHNFPRTKILQRNIESISLKEFKAFNADMFLMSPPCQPFTRSGKQGDKDDPRTKSFFYILDILGRLEKQPSHILVENVKGFETSETRNHLVQTLSSCNYTYKEFLLSPCHLGIPNQRLRYFLVAKQRPQLFVPEYRLENGHSLNEYIIKDCGSCPANHDAHEGKQNVGTEQQNVATEKQNVATEQHNVEVGKDNNVAMENLNVAIDKLNVATETQNAEKGNGLTEKFQEHSDEYVVKEHSSQVALGTFKFKFNHDTFSNYVSKRAIKDYLEDLTGIECKEHLIDNKILIRFGKVMDIVTEDSARTMCFTKAYFHYMEGTGSVLQMNKECNKSEAFLRLQEFTDNESAKADIWKNLNVRFFTAREIANLHHLPADFSFPKEITRKQRYRLLGNSLNSHVVTVLLRFMAC
ncbi:tRNA (cytosine(38)-C(5))-methyltransferase-like [Anneissia japonica]|uniref:tRNA (cytosine(38)-C(5))-methyltransferase-like n=1 Tax=Anneissia japonica TaxID=1529436 RepID=UPI0014255261|nr:tRNA (cytosine(38)-C(5))-methyltransferase-like [Anneissia japonica]